MIPSSQGTYETGDLYLAAYLKLNRCGTPRACRQGGRIWFTFKQTDVLMHHVETYLSGNAFGNIAEFVNALGMLKTLGNARVSGS